MKDQINTIRAALLDARSLLHDGRRQDKALTALSDLEAMVVEPVAWQRRMRPTWGNGKAPWGPWEECSEGQAKDCWRTPLLHDWAYEARALYTATPPAQQPQYEAGDMASAAAQGFRDGVASVTQQPQAEAVDPCKGCAPGGSCPYMPNCTRAKKAPQQAEAAPAGYRLVMVPDAAPGDEPDWDECIRQAEVATGIKVERHTISIVIREVRRWLAHRQADKKAPQQAEAVPADVSKLNYAGVTVWIGNKQVTRIATETEIRHEREPGFVLKNAALMAVAIAAAQGAKT